MKAPADLELPEPARILWLRTRGVIKPALAALAAGKTAYRLGGGTILAARWGHRESTDLDVTTETNAKLIRLAADDPGGFVGKMERLGGTHEYDEDADRHVVTFGKNKVEIWAKSPLFGSGQTELQIAGERETVLSNAQILRGKLERTHDMVVRDVYDLAMAAETDPGSLEAAVNALPRMRMRAICGDWKLKERWLALHGEHQLKGISGRERRKLPQLGKRAGGAVEAALYDELEVRAAGGTMLLTTGTALRGRQVTEIPVAAAEQEFERRGVNEHLSRKEATGRELVEAAEYARATGMSEKLLFREEKGRTTRWRTNLPPLKGAAPS